MQFTSWLIFYLILVAFPSNCTIDINLSEYLYIADHLTLEECKELFVALHFPLFDIPKDLNFAVRTLPKDVSCLDLLLHWNSKLKEGKGETHVKVCHRLNQIGREDLARWLSKTVFAQQSREIRVIPKTMVTPTIVPCVLNSSDIFEEEEIFDEAPWFEIDSILSILSGLGFLYLVFGSFLLCCLCCYRRLKVTKEFELGT